jgi:nucleoside-diphosphate kinase
MVLEGLNLMKTGQVMLGETNSADSKLGTIRGDFFQLSWSEHQQFSAEC